MSSLDQAENAWCVYIIFLKSPVLPLGSQMLGLADLVAGAQSHSAFKSLRSVTCVLAACQLHALAACISCMSNIQ